MNYQQRMQQALEASYKQPYQFTGKTTPVNHGTSQTDNRWTFSDYLTSIED